MEMLNILYIDREVYETFYRDRLVSVFESVVKINTVSYLNQQHWLNIDQLRNKRFYGNN